MNPTFPYSLYLVISQQDCLGKDFLKVAEEAIIGGVDVIQLREKNCTQDEFLSRAEHLKEITTHYNIPLIINDNFQVAKMTDAEGIHVGLTDCPPSEIREKWSSPQKIVGYSIEHLWQLETIDTAQSDYLGISPIFSTPTKTDTVTEWGLEGLRKIRQLTDKPLVAIGRMNKQNIKEVLRSGADCIAVVSALCGAKYPEKAACELKNEILKMKK